MIQPAVPTALPTTNPAHAEPVEARRQGRACFDRLSMSGLVAESERDRLSLSGAVAGSDRDGPGMLRSVAGSERDGRGIGSVAGSDAGQSRAGGTTVATSDGKKVAKSSGRVSRKIRRAARPVPPPAGSDIPAPGPNRLFAAAVLPPSAVIDRARVTVNLAESPLGWLVRRGMVDARQFEAGERLRADFTRAQLAPRTTMAWDAGPAARGARGAPEALDATTAQLAAKRRFAAAVTAVGGGLSDVLWRVVCNGEGLETAERALGWPARAGKVVLLLALDRLADFYQLR